MPTTITLSDEGTRRALLFAVWYHAGRVVSVDENLGDALCNCGLDAIELFQDEAEAQVAEALAMLEPVRACAESIRSAEVGDPVEVSLTPERLADALRSGAVNISQCETYWEFEPGRRERVSEVYDAIDRLLAELPVETLA